MKKLSGNQIRQMFLDYFRSKDHMIEPGASLVPVNDPTLLWINSGVAALKKYLDGREKPKCNRIANAQKCIRTNDIENVGKTSRHHTFFEMLGNWSIGDYFKRESLKMSWEFLTSPEWIGFDPDRIYVTVYPDDTESYDIWTKEIGLNPDHILKSYDNYWQIGEGPCGPDSEIYYDRGPKYDPEGIGEKLFFEEMENDRYVELWNNVFSQYDAKEGVDRKDFKELPQKNIDTGMGLERLVAMIQDGETNFDTDLFLPYIHKTEEFAKKKYSEDKMAYRVIADHIRTCVFALADGATFSNEGRGYVLRRVLRRAMRYGRNIGINKPFLYEIVDTVCDNMKDFYPYLMDKKEFVKKLILKEEESFLLTLSNGEKLLAEELKKASDGVLSGEVIFKLYDTYGFPKEMTIESAEEKGIKCDIDGFNRCMERQKEMARNARDVEESMHNQSQDLLDFDKEFVFTGYGKMTDDSVVTGLFVDGNRVESLDEEGDVVFDHSCFYAESGGQVADTGKIFNKDTEAEVKDVRKAPNGQFMHHVKISKGRVSEGDIFTLEINKENRYMTMANHSSVHLLQAALIKVLGNHIAQAGSYVSKDYARFDFSHYEKVTQEQLDEVERLVNGYINEHLDVVTQVLPLEEAKKLGAIALFDEKYGDNVRVVSMGDVSKEFCGGTHVSNTSELGVFKIVSEESIGSGIRRIESQTQMKAYGSFKDYQERLNTLMKELNLKNIDMIYDRIVQMKNENSALDSELKTIKEKLLNEEANSLISKATDNGKFRYLLLKLNGYEGNLKDYANSIRNKLDGGFVFVVNSNEDRLSMVASAGNKALENGINCGQVISKACSTANGKGGGKPDLAQGGGSETDPQTVIDEVKNILQSM
ncbi:MAG: alanine--tRNA ligase [Erysipelotrichaceae bacterium]|nr:alanine--tRNA ligase [Erysipelotrichaceae bacterium]